MPVLEDSVFESPFLKNPVLHNPVDHNPVDELEAALLGMDRARAREVFLRGVESAGALPFMENQVALALDRIGDAWQAGRLSLSQVYMAGRICEELALSALPANDPSRRNDPRLALAVYEDHHLLGKRMVHAVLRNEGYAVADWGQASLASLLERLRREPVDILLISCLMLSSALRIGRLSEAIAAEGLPVKLVVGGAPFRLDPGLWREVGADAMGRTASETPAIVGRLAGGRQ
jgi:methanogenic corrinoid protein MtbC1